MDHALIDFRHELRAAAQRQLAARRRRRRRTRLVLVALVLAAALSGGALAATTFLGDPAPPAVVHDFGTYTPQLGFTPIPGKAVRVAQNGGIGLFATGNEQGTYCITVTAPWKTSSDQDDGGTCVRAAVADAPFVAGIVGGQEDTVVVAGRVTAQGATEVELVDSSGSPSRVPVGENGFFVALEPNRDLCAHGDWAPAMRAVDASGAVVASSTFRLMDAGIGGCGWPFGLQLPRA